MKKMLLVCLVVAFAFAVQGQKTEDKANLQKPFAFNNCDKNPVVNPIIEQMQYARRNGDWTTYARLLEQYNSQAVVQNINEPGPQAFKPENNPIMRWDGDKILYAGNVAYNSWAMTYNIDDEAISVDHYLGDTLRAAVACTDSTVQVFQSDDRGMTWYGVMGWFWTGYAVYEPEIINDPIGRVYHVATRWSRNNGDVAVFTDSTAGGWYFSMPEATTDTVPDYTICSDRAQYGGDYYLFCAYHRRRGGQGLDQIWLTRSFDYGVTWTAATALQGGGSGFPDLAYGDNDYLYEAFYAHTSDNAKHIYTRRSSDEGANWYGSVEVYSDTFAKQGPQIAAAHDGSGDAWVAFAPRWYGTGHDYDIRWTWTQDFGASWSSAYLLNAYATRHEVLPSITIYDAATYYGPYLSYVSGDTTWANPKIATTLWQSDSTWAVPDTFNDYPPAYTRPMQTWEAAGYPALAYVGENGVNVYYDSWSNTGIEERTQSKVNTNLLSQNRPNPFKNGTFIAYTIKTGGRVSLKVYNTIGQQVAVLVDEIKNAGVYGINWNGTDKNGHALPKGVYILRMQTGETTSSSKLILE